MQTQGLIEQTYGLTEKVTGGKGLFIGEAFVIPMPTIASLADGVALTTISAKRYVGAAQPDGTALHHRLRGFSASVGAVTAVAAGTDPTVDLYRHLPVPPACTAALVLPAAAGNVDNGAHDFGVEFVSAAGDTTPGPVVSVTVTDKTVNGQVLINIPIGPAGTTGRKIIASKAAAHVLYVAATVANNTATTYTYNIADSSLSVAAAIVSTAAATVLAAPIALSSTTRSLADQPLYGTVLAAAQEAAWEGCLYSVRVATGATSGALTALESQLLVELVR